MTHDDFQRAARHTFHATRVAHGLSQTEYAAMLGISVSLTSRIESGDRSATLGTLVSLARVAGHPLHVLVRIIEDSEHPTAPILPREGSALDRVA